MKIAEAFVEVAMKEVGVSSALKAVEKQGAETARKVQKSVDDAARKSEQSVKSTTDKIKQWMGAAAFAGALGASTKAASDLNEAVNVTGLTFKESRGEIEAFVAQSAKLVGMSETVARTTTANFAGFLQNVGFAEAQSASLSIQLTKLAADLGSAFNKEPAEAALALQSALRGEQEPIRAFNVSLSDAALKIQAVKMGLDVSGPTLDANTRAQAALALIMQQTSKVQGDFVNTSGEAANATRIAKAESENASASLGKSFLPVYAAAVKVIGALASGFGALPQPIQLALVALIGLVAIAGPLGDVINAAKALRVAIIGLEASAAPMVAAFAALVAIAAVVAKVLIDRANDQKEAAARAKELTDATIGVTKSVSDQTTVLGDGSLALADYSAKLKDATQSSLMKTIADKNQIDDLTRLGLTYEDLMDLYGTAEEREKRLIDVRKRAIETGEVYLKTTDGLRLSGKNLAQANEDYIRTGRVATETASKFGVSISTQVGGNQGLITSLEQIGKAAADSAEALFTAAQAGDANAAATLFASDAFRDLTPYQQAQVVSITDSAKATKAAAAAMGDEPGGLGAALDGTTPKVEEITRKIKPMKTAEDEAAAAGKDLAHALGLIFGGPADLDAALTNYLGKLDELGKKLRENGKTLDYSTEKGRANRDLIRETTKAALDYTEAQVAQGLPVAEARKTIDEYVGTLRDQLVQLGLNGEEIDAYLKQIGLTPDQITTAMVVYNDDVAKRQVQELLETYKGIPDEEQTKIQALIDEGKYEEARLRLEWLSQDRSITFNLRVARGDITELTQGGPGKAEGGRVGTGVAYTVGERGKELFIPDAPGTVLTAEQTRMADVGGTQTVDASLHVYGNVYGVDDLNAWAADRDRKLVQALRTQRRS